jgi:hypothetical protein
LRALGVHAIKAGFDFQYISNNSGLTYVGKPTVPQDNSTGRGFANSTDDGRDLGVRVGFGTLDQDGNAVPADSFRATTTFRNYAVYLRDSWSVGPLPGLVLNLGVRWDGQELLDPSGKVALSVMKSFAPRVGLVYDFTQLTSRPGRGKLFVNYGRFFESIPADVGERAFGGVGLLVSFPGPGTCPQVQRQPMGRAIPQLGTSCDLSQRFLAGGVPYETIAGLRAPTVDEVVAGIQYEVGLDFVLGISYIHRSLTNPIEDLSINGQQYFLGNPGSADAGVLQQLNDDVTRLSNQAMQPGADQATMDALAKAQTRLDTYKSFSLFPPAVRSYDALVLTASKRLSNRLTLQASYTYSRTLGNYAGTFNSSNGQLNPHTSTSFDYLDLLANRNGPLPTDRPHNFIFSGYYQHPIRQSGTLTAGLTFTAISGRPIEVLGAHAFAGAGEVFILPRGSGGRTPTVTQFDLHLGYDHRITKTEMLGVFFDAVNLFNQREVINVDDIYTPSTVTGITAGRPEDLKRLKGSDGGSIVYNSNYGQATAFQAPLYLRLGAQFRF